MVMWRTQTAGRELRARGGEERFVLIESYVNVSDELHFCLVEISPS